MMSVEYWISGSSSPLQHHVPYHPIIYFDNPQTALIKEKSEDEQCSFNICYLMSERLFHQKFDELLL